MSSFRKRNVQRPVPGTRTSPQTGQVITSSGNPSLDMILGGGLPIGSICLIEEDKHITHSKVLAKYFLAEGILSKQSVFLGSLDDDPEEFLRKLPKPLDESEVEVEKAAEEKNNEAQKNGLRIAWRYNDLPMVNLEQSTTKIGHYFNLLEQMDPMMLDYAETTIWRNTTRRHLVEADEVEEDNFSNEEDAGDEILPTHTNDIEMADASNVTKTSADTASTTSCDAYHGTVMDFGMQKSQVSPRCSVKLFLNDKFSRLMSELHPLLREDKFTGAALVKKSLCRVCITSLGSPLWYDNHFAKDILKLLTLLRAAVRNSVAVCFITIPMHLVAKCDETLVPKIRNLVDFAIELESFAGSERETHPAFKEYSGLLHLHKIAAINALSAYQPETADLAFKLRRKKFVIEKLHLPPELQDNSGKHSSGSEVTPTLSCSAANINANPAASLDF